MTGTSAVATKPPETCPGCDGAVPPRARGRGRPRVYCSPQCRRRFHHRREQEALERERAEERERTRRAYEERVYGKRRAAQLAKERSNS